MSNKCETYCSKKSLYTHIIDSEKIKFCHFDIMEISGHDNISNAWFVSGFLFET